MVHDLEKKIECYLDKEIRTILIEGHLGIGKTEIIKNICNKRYPKRWKYYSGATMDPFIDLIGCPTKCTDPKTNKDYLKLITPKCWADDEVEIVVIDEYNRSKETIRNAIMELVQFSSMNGQEFKNLRHIIGIVNPDDGTYQVDELDPAQKDRFFIQIKLPYEVSQKYFTDKYKEIAEPAIEWWENLPTDIKKLVSPRRLDYALEFFLKDGDINDVLDERTNPGKLLSSISSTSYISILKKLIKTKAKDEDFVNLFNDPNKFFNLKDIVCKKYPQYIKFFPEENLANLLTEKDVYEHILSNLKEPKLFSIIDQIIKSNLNKEMVKKIEEDNRYIEHIYMQDEKVDPEREKHEKLLVAITDRDKAFAYVEQHKAILAGSEPTIDHLISVSPSNYDPNSDKLILFIMMYGISDDINRKLQSDWK